jgi:hypothetical protein
MIMSKEANLVEAYRQARRDFIASCGKAGADAIARVHPALGPDGKPLFCDSAAFGPRDARRGLLLLCKDAPRAWLTGKVDLRPETRLVVVHALDPFAAAWGRPGKPLDWPQLTLKAIAGEDLSRVRTLTVLSGSARSLKPALAAALPHAVLMFRRPATDAQILAAIAGL